MSTYQENLITIRDNCAEKLAEVISAGSTKPTYTVSSKDGTSQTVAWTDYQRMLMGQLQDLNEVIALANPARVDRYGSI